MGTTTLTVRLPDELIAQLDAEAERRSLQAGISGVVSRNVIVRLACEQFLTERVPTPKSKPVKERKPAPAATKALRKPPKGKVRQELPALVPEVLRAIPVTLSGKSKAHAAVSAEERSLQKRVDAIAGGYKSLAKHLNLSRAYVHRWSKGGTKQPWTDLLASITTWLDSQPAA